MEPIQTVNVMKFITTDIVPVAHVAYPDNDKGNEQAEKDFTQWVRDESCITIDDEEMSVHLDFGYFDFAAGLCKIIITHTIP